MGRKDESILDVLVYFPWWVSLLVGAVVFVTLRFVVPAIPIENQMLKILQSIAPSAWPISLVFAFPAIASWFSSYRKRILLDKQSGIDSIRELSWMEFEELLAEAFRRQGYEVWENESKGADGGVDLVIARGGNHYLVQCKHWKKSKVGVKVVRELFGVMHDRSASGAIVATSGMFTQEARTFAREKPIDLIEGQELVKLIQAVQCRSAAPTVAKQSPEPIDVDEDKVRCTECNGEMVVRTARKGKTKGQQFLGCSNFPRCRHTKPIAS